MVKQVMLNTGAALLLVLSSGCATPIGEKEDTGQGVAPASLPVPKLEGETAAIPPPAPRTPSVIPRPPKIEYRELTIARSSLADGPETITVEATEIPAGPTKILDPTMAERLFGNTGITVQWIGWEERGRTWIAVDNQGYWLLMGEHKGEDGGILELEGFVTEIGSDYFIYDGTVKILGTPDRDRLCNVSKRGWRFGITQNRKYWRLREFEWCDRLTDYVDIYF